MKWMLKKAPPHIYILIQGIRGKRGFEDFLDIIANGRKETKEEAKTRTWMAEELRKDFLSLSTVKAWMLIQFLKVGGRRDIVEILQGGNGDESPSRKQQQ